MPFTLHNIFKCISSSNTTTVATQRPQLTTNINDPEETTTTSITALGAEEGSLLGD